MSARNPNRRVWDQVKITDPRYTKPTKEGGRSYTSIAPYYQIMRATEIWGPFGSGWGISEPEFNVHDLGGDDGVLVHTQVKLWYMEGESRFYAYGNGAARLSYTTSKGYRKVDEDAFKKAVTDGLTKALSFLGFSADVFLGYFDQREYRETAARLTRQRQEERAAPEEPERPQHRTERRPVPEVLGA